MKKEKDILDIFEDSFRDGTPVGDSDWQEISLLESSKQFWKWNPIALNAYYVGLIVISFIGTFTYATDYIITKEKVITTYQHKISELEDRLYALENDNKSDLTSKNNKLEINKTEKSPFQDHSTDRSSNKQPTKEDYSDVVIPEEKPSEITTNDVADIRLNGASSNKKEDTVDLVQTTEASNKTEQTKEDSETLKNEVSETLKNEVSEDKPELKTPNKKLDPIIKYVQDTIYEIDSSKVSRWKFKKSN